MELEAAKGRKLFWSGSWWIELGQEYKGEESNKEINLKMCAGGGGAGG